MNSADTDNKYIKIVMLYKSMFALLINGFNMESANIGGNILDNLIIYKISLKQ